MKIPVTNQKNRSGPKPTKKEKETLYSDINANDNLLEGTIVLLQTLEGI